MNKLFRERNNNTGENVAVVIITNAGRPWTWRVRPALNEAP